MERKCDMCGNPAKVDTKTIYGYWAYLCEKCNERYGMKHWNTLLAGLSEGGSPMPTNPISTSKTYEWDESKPSFYYQAIYVDARKAVMNNTIQLTMKSGKIRLITEGNIALLRCVMNIYMHKKDYPIKWEVVQL